MASCRSVSAVTLTAAGSVDPGSRRSSERLKTSARTLALQVCGAGCEVIVTWNKKCAAIVRVNRDVYFGHGNTKQVAQRNQEPHLPEVAEKDPKRRAPR